MKKLYSFVLMATMLLIGTNVSAVTHEVDNADDFYTYWQSANGDVIKLIDAVTLDKTLWLGTDSLQDDSRSIEINLNGYKLTTSADYGFVVTHGKLKITNSRPAAGGQIEGTGGQNLFYLSGSTKKDINPREDDVDYFTHLYIGAGVTLTQSAYCATIIVDGVQPGYAVYPKNDNYKPAKPQLKYATNVYAGYDKDYHVAANTWYSNPNKCVSNGVRIDVHGTIVGTKYGIQSHGYLGTKTHYDRTYASYIKVVEGDTLPTFYDQNNALANVKEYVLKASDTLYAPFIHVYPEARVSAWPEKTGSSKAPMGVYAAGYARWLLEGYIEGGVGVLIKSGTVDIQDATIVGTGSTYNPPASSTSGSNASGSAIVMDSGDSYVGDMDVTISGDSHVSATHGYAIDEAVTTTEQSTKVDHITITGGTFVGGTFQSDPSNPASTITDAIMKVSEPTAEAAINPDTVTTITILGANMQSDNANGVTIGTDNLAEFLEGATAGQGSTHITYVDVPDPNNPEQTITTMVISQGPAPDPSNKVSNQATDASVKWVGSNFITDEITAAINEDHLLRLAELQINDTITAAEDEASDDPNIVSGKPRAQTLYIRDGATLEVSRVILGTAARIIVEAGGKFIVTGTQGITAPVIENIKLQNEENKPAIFLFNPAVSSNKNPNGTVEFISKGFNDPSTSTFGWQKFGIPTKELKDIKVENNVATAFSYYNYDAETPAWTICGIIEGNTSTLDTSKLRKPFEYFEMEHNTATKGTKVTFMGKLEGNNIPELLVRNHFWNGYANSYSAPINGDTLLSLIPSPVDKAFYLYTLNAQNKFEWLPVSKMDMYDIQPMQPFLLRNAHDDDAALVINYEKAVYNAVINKHMNDATPAAASAPRRNSANNFTKVKLIVKGEGCTDRVIVAEDAQFSAEFDNGYDVAKYMNEGINMYVSADEKMAHFATDYLENTYLGFQAVNGGEYTIEFTNVQGKELTLIDHENNARVAMEEGKTYTFTAAANSVNDYRFEIVGRADMPTAIENTEVVKSAKGIYTITGQYVGEMNVWNSLPTGIYVVNGEKLVK